MTSILSRQRLKKHLNLISCLEIKCYIEAKLGARNIKWCKELMEACKHRSTYNHSDILCLHICLHTCMQSRQPHWSFIHYIGTGVAQDSRVKKNGEMQSKLNKVIRGESFNPTNCLQSHFKEDSDTFCHLFGFLYNVTPIHFHAG